MKAYALLSVMVQCSFPVQTEFYLALNPTCVIVLFLLSLDHGTNNGGEMRVKNRPIVKDKRVYSLQATRWAKHLKYSALMVIALFYPSTTQVFQRLRPGQGIS